MSSNHADGSARWNKTAAAALIVSLPVVLALVGAGLYMGLFSSPEPSEEVPPPISLSSSMLDFGKVPLDGAVVRQLVLRNDGIEPLRAELSTQRSNYSVSPRELILHPGISSRISVVVRANEPGELDDRLEIHVERQSHPVIVTLEGRADESVSPMPLSADAGPELASIADNSNRDRSPEEAAARADRKLGRTPASARDVQRTGGSVPTATPRATAAAQGQTAETVTQSSTTKTASTESASPSSPARKVRPKTRNGSGDPSQPIIIDPYVRAADQSVPALSERQAGKAAQISEKDAERAIRLSDDRDGEQKLPDELPEDRRARENDDDIFDDREEEEEDPFVSPTLTISGISSLQMLGHRASFDTQEIGVAGTDSGGPLALLQSVRFPIVPLAFGESMVFSQTAPSAGQFDPGSGQVVIEIPIQIVNNDGYAAPIGLTLTTGTVMQRDMEGRVYQISGAPRVGNTGIVKLVAIEKVPAGFKTGVDERLLVIEVLGSLKFGTDAGSTGLSGFRPIGG